MEFFFCVNLVLSALRCLAVCIAFRHPLPWWFYQVEEVFLKKKKKKKRGRKTEKNFGTSVYPIYSWVLARVVKS